MLLRMAIAFFLLTTLGACESLHQSGPSARAVEPRAEGPYAVVDLDYRVAQTLSAHPPQVLASLAPAASSAPTDLIGEGDVLAVWVYQAGAGPAPAGARADGETGAAPRLTVGRDGAVSPPYAGQVRVAGLTQAEAAEAIRRALRGRLVAPQVVVQVETNQANSVTLLGEVRNAGRYPLTAGGDRLLDVVAAAGGPTRPVGDLAVMVVRGEQTVQAPMSLVMAIPAENVRLAPRDQVRIVYRPRRFSAFGAVGRTAQVDIQDETLTLASALARMGGVDAANANAASVLIFRFERPEAAAALGIATPPARQGVPVVYRLDLRDPAGYFVAGAFEVSDGDLIYVPRSDLAEMRSFFGLVTSITQAAYVPR